MWELSVPFTQFCYESKTAVNNKVYNYKKQKQKTTNPRMCPVIPTAIQRKLMLKSIAIEEIQGIKYNPKLLQLTLVKAEGEEQEMQPKINKRQIATW